MFRKSLCLLAGFALFFSIPGSADDLTDLLKGALQTPAGFELLLRNIKVGKNPTPLSIKSTEKYTHPASQYEFERVELTGNDLGNIRLLIRYPRSGRINSPRPVIFVMSGFFAGSRSLEAFGDVGENILVGYDYPPDTTISPELPARLVQSIPQIPAQVAASLAWVQQQAWADAYKINSVGISLGVIFLPLTQRIAAYQGTTINATVLAYGGARIENMLAKEFRGKMNDNCFDTYKNLLAALTTPLDPSVHLPMLNGRFLVINSTKDELIPVDSANALQELTPRPKETIWLDGPHIGLGEIQVINQVTTLTFNWFRKIGAANP